LLRNEGGSVGTSVAQTIYERRDQLHSLHLGENLDKLNPVVKSFLEQAQPGFLQETGDPAAAKQMTLQAGRSFPARHHRREAPTAVWRVG
jgi:DHA2 family multidrug resistance protein